MASPVSSGVKTSSIVVIESARDSNKRTLNFPPDCPTVVVADNLVNKKGNAPRDHSPGASDQGTSTAF